MNLDFNLLDGLLLHIALTNLNPKMIQVYYSGLDNPNEKLFKEALDNFDSLKEDLVKKLHDEFINEINPLEVGYLARYFNEEK